MSKNTPVISTFLLGLFGIFGIDASEEQILAVINGLLMAGTAIWAIYNANKPQ